MGDAGAEGPAGNAVMPRLSLDQSAPTSNDETTPSHPNMGSSNQETLSSELQKSIAILLFN